MIYTPHHIKGNAHALWYKCRYPLSTFTSTDKPSATLSVRYYTFVRYILFSRCHLQLFIRKLQWYIQYSSMCFKVLCIKLWLLSSTSVNGWKLALSCMKSQPISKSRAYLYNYYILNLLHKSWWFSPLIAMITFTIGIHNIIVVTVVILFLVFLAWITL